MRDLIDYTDILQQRKAEPVRESWLTYVVAAVLGGVIVAAVLWAMFTPEGGIL